MERKTAQDFDQELLYLYDYFVHGHIDRRTFLDRAAKFAVGGMTAVALLEMLNPHYAFAAQVPKEDARVRADYAFYESPEGHGRMRGLLARPANATGRLPAILVIHENRGLNPYIEDVARRAALAGFLAFAPDALWALGGYPGNDDDGRAMQSRLERPKITEDFVAAARFLHGHQESNGALGVTGFCFGGGMTSIVAARLPDLVKAAAPYYGGQPSAEEAAKIKAPHLIHYAALDTRINDGWPAFEQVLKSSGVDYAMHMYPGVNHGFHNDTTPRYDQAAAELSWQRTIAFFKEKLV